MLQVLEKATTVDILLLLDTWMSKTITNHWILGASLIHEGRTLQLLVFFTLLTYLHFIRALVVPSTNTMNDYIRACYEASKFVELVENSNF